MEHPIIINARGKTAVKDSKAGIIARYLASAAGRAKLAQSMINPIRRRLDYQVIARRALVIDQLPDGAVPIYNNDIDVAGIVTAPDEKVGFKNDCVVISSRGKTGRRSLFPNVRRVVIPTFEIYQNPTVSLTDIKARRFNLIDRVVQTAKNQIMEQEDSMIFQALDNAGVKDGSSND